MSGILGKVRREGTTYSLRIRRWCSCGKRMDTGHVKTQVALDWERWFLRTHGKKGHKSLTEKRYEEARLQAELQAKAQRLGGELCPDPDTESRSAET